MRKILLITILLIQTNLFSQENLSGIYTTFQSAESIFSMYEFKENNRFEFKVSGDIGDDIIGKGRFKIFDSKLILDFDKKDKEIEGKIQITEIDSEKIIPIIHNFKIFDINGKAIEGVNIIRTSDGFEKSGKIADKNGKTSFNYQDLNFNVNYEVSLIGFETLKIKVTTENSCSIKIILEKRKPNQIDGGKKELEFERIDLKTIKIQGIEYYLKDKL